MSVAGRGLKVQVRPPHPLPPLFRRSEYHISSNKRPSTHKIVAKRGGGLGALIGRRAPYRVGVS